MVVEPRERDHVLDLAEREALDIVRALGIFPDITVAGITIIVKPFATFSFSVIRKVKVDGVIEFEEIKWDSFSLKLSQQLMIALGLRENEYILEMVIKLKAPSTREITITKMADDRLLDLDWSQVARKEAD